MRAGAVLRSCCFPPHHFHRYTIKICREEGVGDIKLKRDYCWEKL